MTSMRIWLVKKWFVLSTILAIGAVACGGGGGGGGGQNGSGPGGSPGANRTPTRTFTLRPGVATFTATPTEVPPTALPTVTPIIAGGDLVAAVRGAASGSVILLAAGPYAPFTLRADDVHGPITLLADRSELQTSSTGALARVEARGASTAITLDGVADLIIDGLTITGGSLAGIRVIDGAGITIRNSVIRDNTRDGIRLERTVGSLLFNNLVLANSGAGISVVGTVDLQVVNNTVYSSGGSGVIAGDSLLPSSNIILRNNIFSANRVRGISIDPTTAGYDGNYNLNLNGYSRPELRGAHDITNGDPLFNNPGNENGFYLPPTDEDCDGGSVATDAGDPDTAGALLNGLAELTTQTDQRFDCIGRGCCPVGCPIELDNGDVIECRRLGFADMGFHYISLQALVKPTSTPRPTRTRSPSPTRTGSIPRPTATAIP
jgi:parallel beta-helix repeat protein